MENAAELIGTWHSDPEDDEGIRVYGNATLRFNADGTLLYIVHGTDADQVIRLTFRAKADVLVTDQPSKPRSVRSHYEFTHDGKLVIAFKGQQARYIRAK